MLVEPTQALRSITETKQTLRLDPTPVQDQMVVNNNNEGAQARMTHISYLMPTLPRRARTTQDDARSSCWVIRLYEIPHEYMHNGCDAERFEACCGQHDIPPLHEGLEGACGQPNSFHT